MRTTITLSHGDFPDVTRTASAVSIDLTDEVSIVLTEVQLAWLVARASVFLAPTGHLLPRDAGEDVPGYVGTAVLGLASAVALESDTREPGRTALREVVEALGERDEGAVLLSSLEYEINEYQVGAGS